MSTRHDALPLADEERLERGALVRLQADRLARLIAHVNGRSPFYTRKLQTAGLDLDRLEFPRDLPRLPFTTKVELVADQQRFPPWGSVLCEAEERYVRFHQTSSTTGSPLRWPDTAENWQAMLECWKAVYRAAHVTPADRIFFPFSFGPFFGFWTAFEAATQIGALCIPGGGMSTELRLAMLRNIDATVVCCTPTYALRMAEVAAQESGRTPLAASAVRLLIVAGEPGGNIPTTRALIEDAWGARVIDHHGLTEVGVISFECEEAPGGLHVNESHYLCEVLDPSSHQPVPDGTRGELVITTLSRLGSPVVRYRTGDIVVRSSGSCACGRTWARLEGGILGRMDDMTVVRGVNVYPSAIEAVVREFADIVEFRSIVRDAGMMRSLGLEIEVAPRASGVVTARRVATRLREALGLNVSVQVVTAGTLPRYEMKARRFFKGQVPPPS